MLTAEPVPQLFISADKAILFLYTSLIHRGYAIIYYRLSAYRSSSVVVGYTEVNVAMGRGSPGWINPTSLLFRGINILDSTPW
jgi:hypothetical protein